MSEPAEVSRVTCKEGLGTWCWLTSWFPGSKSHFSCCLLLCSGRAFLRGGTACAGWPRGMIHLGLCVLCVHGGKKQQTQICFWSALFDSTQDETKSIYSTARPPWQACASLFALLLTWEILFCLEQLRLCKWGNLRETAKLWIVFVVEKGILNRLYQNGS